MNWNPLSVREPHTPYEAPLLEPTGVTRESDGRGLADAWNIVCSSCACE